MIKLGTVIFITLLSACTVEENSDQQTNTTLTGTWISSSVNTSYDNSNVLVGSETTYSTLYFTESNADIQLSSCEDYSNPQIAPSFLQKNNGVLSFINVSDTPFTIVSTTELTREYEITYSFGKILYNQTLTKTSSTIDLSRGSLQLNGPLSGNNQNHACLVQSFNSAPSQNNRQQISIPFDNRDLRLDVELTHFLTVGNYIYDANERGNSPVLYSFDVSSNSDVFWNTINSSSLSPTQAEFQISSVGSNLITGTFSFIGQDSGNYTGSFNFVPY